MTHIKMDENYKTTTKYYGTLDDKFHFTVDQVYDSYTKTYFIEDITFDPIKKEENMPTEYWDKSKERIKDFIDKWLFGNYSQANADIEAMDMLKDGCYNKDETLCSTCNQYPYSETDRHCPVCYRQILKEGV